VRPFEEDRGNSTGVAGSFRRGVFRDHYRYRYIPKLCREFRKHPAVSEDMLWQALRNRKLGGLEFYRQHPSGRFMVDFYCHEARLVIEIDGGIHNSEVVKEYDQLRQGIIENYDVRFYRCTSEDVENDLERVLRDILEASKAHPRSLSLRRVGSSGNSQKGECSKGKRSNV
jgi:very-short-patch-repair endonuclease